MPACPNCHKSPLPMGCRTSPTLGTWVHWSGACGSLLPGLPHQPGNKMTEQSGEVMVRSSAAGLPLSQPAMRMSAGLVFWDGFRENCITDI